MREDDRYSWAESVRMRLRLHHITQDIGHVHHIFRVNYIIFGITVVSIAPIVLRGIRQNRVHVFTQILFRASKYCFTNFWKCTLYMQYTEAILSMSTFTTILRFLLRVQDVASSIAFKTSLYFQACPRSSFQRGRHHFFPLPPGLLACYAHVSESGTLQADVGSVGSTVEMAVTSFYISDYDRA